VKISHFIYVQRQLSNIQRKKNLEQRRKVAECESRVTPVLRWEVCQLCTRRSKVTFRRLNSIRSNRL